MQSEPPLPGGEARSGPAAQERDQFRREMGHVRLFNTDVINHVAQENKELKLLQSNLVVDAKNAAVKRRLHAREGPPEGENALRQRLNRLRDSVERRRRTLNALRDKLEEVTLQTEEDRYEHDHRRKIRVLENNLDLVTIKFNEACSIRKTYENIIRKVKDEQVRYTNQLSALEKELQWRSSEAVEKSALCHLAVQARQEAYQALATVERDRRGSHAQRAQFLARNAIERQRTPTTADQTTHAARETKRVSEANAQLTLSPVESSFHRTSRGESENLTVIFRKLYEITGAKDVNEICQKLVNQEQTQQNIEELRQNYIEEIEAKHKELEQLKHASLTAEQETVGHEPSPFQEVDSSAALLRKKHTILTKKLLELQERHGKGKQLADLFTQKLSFARKNLPCEELSEKNSEQWVQTIKEKIRWMRSLPKVINSRISLNSPQALAAYVNPLLLNEKILNSPPATERASSKSVK